MSVTTTSNARITATRHYLADYELHHSQPSPATSAPAPGPNEHAHSLSDPSNPSHWETNWRRVPAYRPVADQVDEQRNTYTSGVERAFVRVMFGGVWMMASASKLWRATGGRWNSEFFKYKVGGEW